MTRKAVPTVALATAALTALLVVPGPHLPKDVPYPPVDPGLTSSEHISATSRGQHSLHELLNVDIRGVGERVRRCGQLEGTQPGEVYLAERTKVRQAVRALLQDHREQELIQLRDLQALIFVDAVVQHLQQPAPETERTLKDLGANILSHLGAGEWLVQYQLLQPTLRALFSQRWSQLLAVDKHLLLAPTANDQRLIQRFVVLHQLRKGAQRDNQALLSTLALVPEYSPDYPSDYARGIVLYQMGAFADSVAAFERHLRRHPDGKWAMRAHSFRLEALLTLGG